MCLLQEVLRCCSEMEHCREADRRGKGDFDLGAIMGELDWHTELTMLMQKNEEER